MPAHAMIADAGIIDFNLTGVLAFIIFLVTIYLLWRLALGPITRILQQRDDKVQAGLRAAEEAERRLAEVQSEVQRLLDEARTQAREVMTRAHQEATADSDAVRNRARQEAEGIATRARADIEVERDRAIQELRAQVSALVVEAAGRIIGATVDESTHRRLIEESLAEVQSR